MCTPTITADSPLLLASMFRTDLEMPPLQPSAIPKKDFSALTSHQSAEAHFSMPTTPVISSTSPLCGNAIYDDILHSEPGLVTSTLHMCLQPVRSAETRPSSLLYKCKNCR